jgi:hypoxanthine phosphoribosyltransferase
VASLAAAIRRDYGATSPLLVGTLKGAFVFLADLVRALNTKVQVDFVQISSYGSDTVSSGQVTLLHDLSTDIGGKDVLVVEDIIDSGHSAAFLFRHLAARRLASLRLCTLVDKPARRHESVVIDYKGFTIDDVFIVGYGMDWNEDYRHLPDICRLHIGQ